MEPEEEEDTFWKAGETYHVSVKLTSSAMAGALEPEEPFSVTTGVSYSGAIANFAASMLAIYALYAF